MLSQNSDSTWGQDWITGTRLTIMPKTTKIKNQNWTKTKTKQEIQQNIWYSGCQDTECQTVKDSDSKRQQVN